MWLSQVDAPWEKLWEPSQVMAMELAVLQALGWRVGAAPTAPYFLDRLIHVVHVERDAGGRLVDYVTAARNTAGSLVMTALMGTPLFSY